jgi:hypothetical protein
MLRNSSVSIVAMLAGMAFYAVSVPLVAMFAAIAMPRQGHAQGSAPNLSGHIPLHP